MRGEMAEADVIVVMGIAGIAVDLPSIAYAAALVLPTATFVFVYGWKQIAIIQSATLRDVATNPEGYVRGGPAVDNDAVVIARGIQRCYMHRRLVGIGRTVTAELRRHPLLMSAGSDYRPPNQPAAQGRTQVACVFAACTHSVHCRAAVDMVCHVADCHYSDLQMLGVSSAGTWDWAMQRLKQGTAAQRDLVPLNRAQATARFRLQSAQAERDTPGRQHRLEAIAPCVHAEDGLATASEYLVPAGNRCMRDTRCTAGFLRQESEWTTEAIADHCLAHRRTQPPNPLVRVPLEPLWLQSQGGQVGARGSRRTYCATRRRCRRPPPA